MPTISTTTFSTTTTSVHTSPTTPGDNTSPNLPVTTMAITKNVSSEWEVKIEKARECLLDYLARRENLQSISEWVELDSSLTSTQLTTTVWVSTTGLWMKDLETGSATEITTEITFELATELVTELVTESETNLVITESATTESEMNFTQVQWTTPWTLAANIATNQLNGFEYKNCPSIIFLAIIFLH